MTTATLTRNPTEARTDDGDNGVDGVFADLARRARNDAGAANELRQLLLPSCRDMAGHLGDSVVAEALAAAYAEVIDWAEAEGHVTVR